jgi:hypothetical protein
VGKAIIENLTIFKLNLEIRIITIMNIHDSNFVLPHLIF